MNGLELKCESAESTLENLHRGEVIYTVCNKGGPVWMNGLELKCESVESTLENLHRGEVIYTVCNKGGPV